MRPMRPDSCAPIRWIQAHTGRRFGVQPCMSASCAPSRHVWRLLSVRAFPICPPLLHRQLAPHVHAAAWACSRFRRSSLLKLHSLCGFAAIAVLSTALTRLMQQPDRLFQVLCLGLSLMGMAQVGRQACRARAAASARCGHTLEKPCQE